MDYALLKVVLEKLHSYEESAVDKKQIDLNGFVNFLASSDVRQFESNHLMSGDETAAERDERVKIHDTPSTIEIAISQNITYLYRYAKQYTKKALKNSELKTTDEFTYLATLLNFNRLSKIDLINKSVQEKTTGMETIKRLLKNNLIEQFDNPGDQRSQLVQLTEKGRGVLFSVFQNMSLVSKVIPGDLTTSEKMQLAYLLKKLDNYHHDLHVNKKGEDLKDLIYKGE
ncbi:MarR family transcriptional regulator [Sphingobacteriaceae bacterium]|nr:MarR family transcriptional regulator [Sphingobacteriaceae bacterium]